MEVENSIRLARAYAAKKLIWFSPALYRCRIVLTEKVQVAAIDKHYNVYWNPQKVQEILNFNADRKRALSELAFIWVHEICHVLREHFERAAYIDADRKKWNYAADMEINDSVWEGINPPASLSIVTPKVFGKPDGRTAEWYYNNLPPNNCNAKQQMKGGSCENAKSGEGEDDSDSNSDSNSEGDSGGYDVHRKPKPSDDESQVDGKSGEGDDGSDSNSESGNGGYDIPGKPRPWDDGSGMDGKSRPWEKEDKDPQTLTDMSRTIMARDVARQMKAHLPGTVPGGWGVWIKNTLEPKVDWRKILKNKLATAITVGRGSRIDYTFSRPNRRASIYNPIIMPSLSGTQSHQLLVVIDTSGSMYGHLLNQAVAELFGILKAAHETVKLVPCDARTYDPIDLKRPSDIKKLLELPGGGGTNMVAGIDFAVQQKPIPDTVLVLTDGYTPYPNQKYKIPVIFGILGQDILNQSAMPPNPPWGADTTVFIDLGK